MTAQRRWSAVLVHGAGGGAWEWNQWRGVLEAHAVAVQAIELEPGTRGLASTHLHDYVAQARSALQSMPRPRVIVGASLGGLVAALCASEADALVLVNPLPPAPWHRAVARTEWQPIVQWRSDARLQSTRRALPDADDATALWSFRHWRDESGMVLNKACAGVKVERPGCPVLFIGSAQDEDVPPAVISEWAHSWQCESLKTLPGSHVGPLLGRHAQTLAVQTVAWLNQLA